MTTIKKVEAYEILDSRGYPTIETKITLADGSLGIASVPSGASTGQFEARELRDNDLSRFHGKGVLEAINNIHHIIAPAITNEEADLEKIDSIMINLDGTDNKDNLGANAILSVSMALLRAIASSDGLEVYQYLLKDNLYQFPMPLMNVINGGKHANSCTDFQEYMIIPQCAQSIKEAIRIGSEVFHSLKEILKEHQYATTVGDEGGFAPSFHSNQEPLDFLVLAIKKAGYKVKEDVAIALDIAASEFYNHQQRIYDLSKSQEGKKTSQEMIAYYEYLISKYPIISIEDALADDDYEGWTLLTKRLGNKVQLVGDDLFVTNASLLQKGIKMGMGNAILIKPNQIGTISEMIKTIDLAKQHGYKTIMSHRSGETEDTLIADLAVGLNTGQIKAGSLSRSERVAKYNRLMRIERMEKNMY